ncbi:hypothetical protein F4808DRAFT_203395 [Astrocystis sublimbata]|nr:hypothetical protein F4808DRAFT_203395 [Astrocystis sublimbata]
MSANYSFYSIPVAWFLAGLPGMYAKALGGTNYDVANPRKFAEYVEKDDKLDKQTKNKISRSEAAVANAFETLPLFVGAVIAANYASVPVETINTLVGSYLGSRVAYNVTYIWLQENRKLAPLRSVFWMVGIFSWVTLFIKAGNRL